MGGSDSESRLSERALLFERLYWSDDLHQIGTELDIPAVKQAGVWNLDRNVATFEIAKALNDQSLADVISKHPPKVLWLSGFQGQFYTVTEEGKLLFSGSWNSVRSNVQKALKKWENKTYGVLQALVNRGGKASYFEIIDEIEKVLGKGFVPSFILPSLGPLKLVFKTGSNKYPDWTMPAEIIPAVKRELDTYQVVALSAEAGKALGKILESVGKKMEDEELLLIERKLDRLVAAIAERKREINLVFVKKFKTKMFRDDEWAIIEIKKPCSNEGDFTNRIQGLCSLLDNIEKDELKKKVNLEKDRHGSIDIMEAFLRQHSNHVDTSSIEALRKIMVLRSKKFPVHHDDPRFLDATEYFGYPDFPPDWQGLWENVLEGCGNSLKKYKTSFDRKP